MNDQLERDVKMIELYESIKEFYEERGHPDLARHYDWVLEVYDRLEEETHKNEQLKEENEELQGYIEDWQIKPRRKGF